MSLPACQQRVLDTIEKALQRHEPHLTSMFAIFTRLHTNERVPRTESLEPRPWWVWSRARRLLQAGQPGRTRRSRRRPRRSRNRRAAPRSAGQPTAAMRAMLRIPLAVVLVVSIVLLGMRASQPFCSQRSGPHGPIASQSHLKNCPSLSSSGALVTGRSSGRE